MRLSQNTTKIKLNWKTLMACKEVYGNVKGGWGGGGEKNRLQTSEKLENFAV